MDFMDLWHAWTGLLQGMLQTMTVSWGFGAGLAIILMTVAVRTMLMPLTWSLAYRAAVRQAKLSKLQPMLQSIRERHAKDPRTVLEKTQELYREHDVSIADAKGLLGALIQMPVIYGLYTVLRAGVESSAFLWIRNLGRPDFLLAILAALSTSVVMAVAPHMSGHVSLALLLLPAVICLIAALHLSSGVALYWVTSNIIGTAQSLVLRRTLRRQGLI